MGVTGSGKSTFISLLAEQIVEVQHSLQSGESCAVIRQGVNNFTDVNRGTLDIGVYSFVYPRNKTVFLIDTPGFDDTSRSDTDILKDISCFLATMYVNKWRLVGVIYLHRITDPRMGGSALKNLHMFQKLCGTRSLPCVTLATTMWGDLEPGEIGLQTGLRRQEELQTPQFWGPMIAAGSRIVAHDGSRNSAYAIISTLVENNATVVPDIVLELVHEQKTLDETAAGKYVQKQLLEAREKFERDLADLQESMEEAVKESDERALREIKREREEAEETVKRKAHEWDGLKVSMQQLTQEKRSQFRDMASNMEQRQRTRAPNQETLARDKRIQELEYSLRQKERQHEQALARQQIFQQSQTTAQLQHIRFMVEESSRQQRELQRQLDYERRLRLEEQSRGNPIVAFLKNMVRYGDERPQRRYRREEISDGFSCH